MWSKLTNNLADNFELEGVTITLKNVWNDFIFNQKFLNHNVLLQRVKEELYLYRATNEWMKQAPNSSSRDETQWCPPFNSYFKANCDAAVDNKKEKVEFGIVVRNSAGNVMACLNTSQDFYSQPILAECLAL